MKETPENIAAYTGLSLTSVRRHVLATIKETGSRKQYAKDMNLNGLAVPTYRRIAERSTDETAKQFAAARVASITKTAYVDPAATKQAEIHATDRAETDATDSGALHETIAPETPATVADETGETVAQISLVKRAMNVIESYMLSVINIIDIGLIFLGLWRLYGLPGIALAIMVSLYFVKAQIIARNPELRQSNYNALQVVGWMCGAAFVLHAITFWNANPLQWISLDGSGTDLLQNSVKLFSAIGPAAFVSILAYKAVETETKIAKEKTVK